MRLDAACFHLQTYREGSETYVKEKCYEANLALKAIIMIDVASNKSRTRRTDKGGRLSTTLSYSAMERENSQARIITIRCKRLSQKR